MYLMAKNSPIQHEFPAFLNKSDAKERNIRKNIKYFLKYLKNKSQLVKIFTIFFLDFV